MRAASFTPIVIMLAGVVPATAFEGTRHEVGIRDALRPLLFATITKPYEHPRDGREKLGHLARGIGKGEGHVMQNGLRRLVFQRSGGSFPMTLSGTVVFGQAQATVTSDSAPGERSLSPEELAMFERLDIAGLRSWAASIAQAGQPDRYQYDVALEVEHAAPLKLRFYEGTAIASSQDASGPGDLAAWVRNEAAAIWKRKATPQP